MGYKEINAVIDHVRTLGGEPYSFETGSGHRRPIREDTETFLIALVLARQPRHILELGTAYGASALCMALGSPRAVIHTVEQDAKVATLAEQHFVKAGVHKRVRVRLGSDMQAINAIDALVPMPNMVFFDHAMSRYEGALDALLAKKRKNPLLLVADNATDHADELEDFLAKIWQIADTCVVFPTECGLLVAHIA